MTHALGSRSLDSFRDPVPQVADPQRQSNDKQISGDSAQISHTGEVIESSTAQLVAESVRLHGAPAFGQFVRIETEPMPILGVVHNAQTQSLEANRRPSAYGKSEEELRLEQPQIFELLRTHFDVLVLGYLDGAYPVLAYPPQPARIHSFVYLCDAPQVEAVTANDQLLRSLLDPHDPSVPSEASEPEHLLHQSAPVAPHHLSSPTHLPRVWQERHALLAALSSGMSAPPPAVPPALVVSMIEVVPASVTPVPASPRLIVSPELRSCPFSVTPDGAVAVSPPLNSSVSAAALPSVSVPVLAKVTALVMIVPLPNSSRS